MLDERTRNILTAVRDDATENGIKATFVLHRENSHLLRIGNNSVSLSTTEVLSRLDIEVINGRKQGSHTHLGMIDSEEVVRDALDISVRKARVAMDKDYQPPATVIEDDFDEGMQFDRALEQLDPSVKTGAFSRIIEEIGQQYNFSGSWSSGSTEQYLISTENRNEAYNICSDFRFTVVLKHPELKWELMHTQTGWRAEDFDVAKTIEYFRQLLPVFEDNTGFEVEPGDYTVLFGSEAISEIVGMALWTGLNGRGWEEKMGWTAQNSPGDEILGGNITLTDDPNDANTFRFGFDLSGKRRKRFPLVENGRLLNLMYDSNSAAKYGKKPTGHDIGSTSYAMSPGDGPSDPLDAVKDMGRVMYIPALHYMNLPNRSKGIFTASSRFSAVLIEDGKIVRPIFSSRITDTFQNILCNVRVISSGLESVNGSNTYGRRAPVAMSVPGYLVAEGVKITDCADSF
jgi:predicted Zn-dependent protease